MLDSLKNLFKKNDTSVLGIDIGSSSIKIVQLRRKGSRAILETYGELALGPYAQVEVGRATSLEPQKISEALLDLLKESKTTTKRCGIAIPFGASLMSLIEMPAVAQKQLDAMVPIEARKYIPVPISEVMLDWWVIPKPKDEPMDPDAEEQTQKKDVAEKTDVLIVAIHNDTINKYQQIVQKSGLNASFFEIELFSSIRSVLGDEMAPVMILDMGAALTKLYIVERGVLRSSHNINRGSQDITLALSKSLNVSVAEAEVLKRTYGTKPENSDPNIVNIIKVNLDYIFSEIDRVIFSYEKKSNKNISKVILLGGGVKLAGFADMAKQGLETETEVGNPFVAVETPAFLENMLKTTGPEFAVAVGIALRRLQEIE
jgi:type IV pilus assembly protein PilM